MKRLTLSKDDKKLLGVCGGIGEYYEVDPTLVRLLWMVVTLITGVVPGLVAYLIAAMIMPNKK